MWWWLIFLGRRLHEIRVEERLFGVFSGGVSDRIFFVWFSVESYLLISVGFLKTCTSPQWWPVSSDPAASSHGRAGSSR
jgi:hypothetical protein